MGNNDYGHFGSGSTGYAHYTQAHGASFSNAPSPSGGCGCRGAFFTICLPIILICGYFGVIGILGSFYAIKYYCIGFIGLGEFILEFIGWTSLPILFIGLPIYFFFKK